MENQLITSPSDISSNNQAVVNQPLIPPQTKPNLILPILLTLLISGVVFGFGGYYLGISANKYDQQLTSEKQTNQVNQNPDLTQQPIENQPSQQVWNSYIAKSMDITFKIPQDWIVDESNLGVIRVQNFQNDSSGRGYDSSLDQEKMLFSIYEWNTGENEIYLTPQSLGSLNQDCIASGEGNTLILQENEIQEGSLTIYYRQTKCSQAETGKNTDSYYLFNGKGDVYRVVLGMNAAKAKEVVLDFLKTFKF